MTAVAPTTLGERLNAVHVNIRAACQRANRPVESVKLVAVSKTHPPETILEAIKAAQLDFGENRVEEAATKIRAVQAAQPKQSLTWHMIGHVQSRKAEDVIALFGVIHSLDSLKLAERYSKFAVSSGREVTVLLEVNVSGEASKSGFEASHWQQDRTQRESLWNDIRRIIELPGIHIGGLMTMAPIAEDAEQVRPVFSALRLLRDALASDFPAAKWSELSMGMTDDYPIAIEEGATIIRVGRAIFGPREVPYT
jgi:pyridoxal phosphate enzyme (YggS family)